MPAGHAEHDEFVPVPDRENEPAGHAEHDEFVPAPEVEKEPAGQAVQLADDWAAYVPAVQGVHSAGPVVPEAAAKPPLGENEPAAHAPAQAELL